MNHPLLGQEGETHLLLGNEAIVRGALEAGINVVTCYPGTPSSEVPDTFNKLKSSNLFNLEYSINEKVALEVAGGAALAGALSLVTMKHVGVNVAADPLLTMTYTGLPGGLVLFSADDPGCHASQNEQDNRTYARFASMPCFEPSNPQEAKEMTKAALLLARETEQPTLLRTTTRVNHMRGAVTFGALTSPAKIKEFSRNPRRFIPVPAVARLRHHALAEAIQKIQRLSEQSPFNFVQGKGKFGIIASGISRAYLHDVLVQKNWEEQVQVFHLGMSWPLPEERLLKFINSVSTVLVLEEGEGLLEKDLRALAQVNAIRTPIYGKHGSLTIFAEYSTLAIKATLAPFLNEQCETKPPVTEANLPQRPPNLCAGCAHRSAFYAVRQIFKDDAFYSSDIGCYTLGLLPPHCAADFLFCMGSSISAGSGFASVSEKPVVAFIGDSTFFHSGLTGLANAIFNKHNLLIVILDNGTTAMTGHQPNPGVAQDVLGENATHLDIASIVTSMGVEKMQKVRGYNQKAMQKALTELKKEQGVRVLIVEEPCVLFARRTLKKGRTQKATVEEQNASATNALATFACQAFCKNDDIISVDTELCAGCMVCMQISPSFKAQKKDI